MIIINQCPFCSSQNITQYNQAGFGPEIPHEIMPGVEVSAAIINYYSVCQNCSLIFQNPRLSDEELDRFYSEGYYRRMPYGAREEEFNFEGRRVKVDAEIISSYINDIESQLDIGCGKGYLLEALNAKVKIGVEQDVDYVKVKGIVVYKNINNVRQKKFDLVTATHVLEHVVDPLNLLKSIKKFTKKGGYAVIEVPVGDASIDFVHLYIFNVEVLKNMCAKVGLRVIHVQYTPHLLLICKLNEN